MSSLSEMQDLKMLSSVAISGIKWYQKYKTKTGEFDVLIGYLSNHNSIGFSGAGASPGSLPSSLSERIGESYSRLRAETEDLKKDEVPETALVKAKTNLEFLGTLTTSAILSVTNKS